MLPNRAIYSDDKEMQDIIFGQFFVCYAPIESEKFMSLPEDLAKKYEEKFKNTIRKEWELSKLMEHINNMNYTLEFLYPKTKSVEGDTANTDNIRLSHASREANHGDVKLCLDTPLLGG